MMKQIPAFFLRFLLFPVACSLVSLLGVDPASAQVAISPDPSPSGTTIQISPRDQAVSPEVRARIQRAFRGADLKGKDGPMAAIGRDLATLYYQYEAEGAAGIQRLLDGKKRQYQTSRAQYHSPVSRDGRSVAVTAIASEDPSRLRTALRDAGMRTGGVAGNVVSGRLPIPALKEAAQLPSLRGMFPVYAQTHVGSVHSEADTAHSAFEGRANLGVDGSGQKVCALSDSYDNPDDDTNPSQDASQDVSDGDLPGSGNPDGRTTPVDVLDDSEPGGDEGRAMLQLIHDIAPGAELGFHTAAGGLAAFVDGIRDLADPNQADCSILVDDIRYNVEPFYQDGPVTNVVDSVVNEGIPYFSSAGNDGQNSYEAPFRDSGNQGVISNTSVAHDFDPSDGTVDTLQRITIKKGGKFRIFTLQWTDPSAIVSGSVGADTDIDVALVNDTLGIVAQSARNSDLDGNGVPFEGIVEHTNNGNIDTDDNGVADTTFHLVIEKAAGPDPDQVKYIYSGSDFTVEEFDTLGPTIYGHPMAENAMAVAAAPFVFTEAYSNRSELPYLESFSSKGGIKIRFGQTGTPLPSPEEREKPDVTGTDGIDNTFFGSDFSDSAFGGIDSDPHPNFFGTSAAAPNVAAIAALIMDANPGFTVPDLYSQLESNAKDVTRRIDRNINLQPIPSGVDDWSGHGFVQATASALPVELARFEATADGDAAVLTWKTASETNNAGFIIEHRRGDGSFEKLAYKQGAGTTSEPHTYRYRTPPLQPGTHVFRLGQEDLDGSVTYSKEVTVRLALSGEYSVSPIAPSPVRHTSTVSVTVQDAQNVQVAVYNVIGQRVTVLHDGPIPANDPTTMRVGANLQSGVYFLRIEGESFSTTRKFVQVQ